MNSISIIFYMKYNRKIYSTQTKKNNNNKKKIYISIFQKLE